LFRRYGSTDYQIFNGYLTTIENDPDAIVKDCILECTDGTDLMAKMQLYQMPFMMDKTAFAILSQAFSTISWPFAFTDCDTSDWTYPITYTADMTLMELIHALEESEYGFFYIDRRGYVRWEDMNHRTVNRTGQDHTHTSTNWTVTGTIWRKLKPLNLWHLIENRITLRGIPKIQVPLVPGLTVLWYLAECAVTPEGEEIGNSPEIAAGATATYQAFYTDANGNRNVAWYVHDQTAPVAYTDYIGNQYEDGSGTDYTSYLQVSWELYADGGTITVKNNAAFSVFLTKLWISGAMCQDEPEVASQAYDTTSISTYRLRDAEYKTPFFIDSAFSQDVVDTMIADRKDPVPYYEMEIVNNSSTAHIQQLSREISDRITVQDSRFGIDDDCYIEHIRQEWSCMDGVHHTFWTVSWTS
jgi:hypothetical protein